MRAVFETGADLGLVEGEKVQGREKSLTFNFGNRLQIMMSNR